MAAKPKIKESEVSITEIQMTNMQFNLVGTSPLIIHNMSQKAREQLLFPSPTKNAAEKASSMKHEPFDEFREAAYRFRGDDQPTRLYMPAGSFHAAMANAAIDMVGAKKAQIGRLTSVPGLKIPVWGVPEIIAMIVRSSDMARTPDIRTLPILPRWASVVGVQFVGSLIKEQSIANLIAASGVIIGIGDGRPEKGKLTYGQFRIVSSNDPEFRAIVAQGGRKAQDAGLADPAYYDAETEELLTWFMQERDRRVAAPPKSPKGKRMLEAAASAAKGNGRHRRKEVRA